MKQVALRCLLTQDTRGDTVDQTASYRSVGVLNRGRGLFRKPSVKGAETSYRTLYQLKVSQVVYSKLFAWEGSVAIVDDDAAGSFVSSEFPHFDVDVAEVEPLYLRHVIAADFFSDALSRVTTGMGQRRQRVNIDSFLDIMIPLPGIDEQRDIVARLDRLDQTSGHLITSERRLENECKALHERMLFGDLAELNAATCPLGRLLDETASIVPVEVGRTYSSAGIRKGGQGLFPSGIVDSTSTRYSSLRQIREGEILYSKLKAFEGAIAVVPRECDGYFTSHEFPTFAIKDGSVAPGYLRHVLASDHFTHQLAGASKGVGARRERLSPSRFLELCVPLPPRPAQERTAGVLDKMEQLRALGRRQGGLARALPQAARNEVFSKLV